MIRKKKQVRFVLAGLLFLLPFFLYGEDREIQESASAGTSRAHEEELLIEDPQAPVLEMEEGLSTLSFFDFARMFAVLAGVILLIYLVYYLLKKAGGPKYQGNNLIRILSTQNLHGSRALHLVEVGNEVFLVGSADSSVRLVSAISDKETLDQIKLYGSETASGEKSFAEMLFNIFGKTAVSPEPASKAPVSENNDAPGYPQDRGMVMER